VDSGKKETKSWKLAQEACTQTASKLKEKHKIKRMRKDENSHGPPKLFDDCAVRD
jgi:hypothetical protein